MYIYSILVSKKETFQSNIQNIYIYSHSEPFVPFIATENVVVNHRSQLSVCVSPAFLFLVSHTRNEIIF